MITEEQIIQSVTDKLIEVAKHPEMRKEFNIVVENWTFDCHKNNPMMCDVDRHVLATFYAGNIAHYAKSETDCQEFYEKSNKYIDKMAYFIDRCRAHCFLDNITARFYVKKKDYDKALDYKYSAFIYSGTTPEGAELKEINELIKLARKAGDQDFESYVCEIEDYFKEFEKKLNSESNPEQAWPELARKAINDIREIVIQYTYEEGEERDEEEIEDNSVPFLQAHEIIKPPKRISPLKGEFDHYYNKAEKGDTEAQRKIANAYREGKVVTKNERLANFWQAVADEHRYIE